MNPLYFIKAKIGIVDIFLDVREISHVIIRKNPRSSECSVSMKNGDTLIVDEELFTSELEKLQEESNPIKSEKL